LRIDGFNVKSIKMIRTIFFLLTLIFEAFFFWLASQWFLRSPDTDVRRRWIASAIVGGLSGLAINFILTVLLLVGVFLNAGIDQGLGRIPGLVAQLPGLVVVWANLLLGVLAWMTLPVVFICTFGSYYQFWSYSNSLIDRCWRRSLNLTNRPSPHPLPKGERGFASPGRGCKSEASVLFTPGPVF
jgi:hypothetical protein